jgi:penicillin-binding protein 2
VVFAVGYSHQAVRAGRAHVLMALAFVAFSACFLKLAYLQIYKGKTLSRASEKNHTQILVERAPRGRILDRNGVVLADDQPVFVALFSPLGLDPMHFEPVATRLSNILQIQGVDIQKRIYSAVKTKSMVRLSDRITREQAFEILQARTHLPGVSLTVEEQRHYPFGKLASHVLGHVGQITDGELERFADKGYQSGDWIGKMGLERLYDPSLHGLDGGFLIEVDARGRQVRVLRHVEPQAGKDLVLTIDHKLQELAEKRIATTGHPGAAIVMSPRSGELLALASSPGFDPNVFMPLGDPEERKGLLLNTKELPLFNRSIQATYPPGSTFKIITSLALLEKRAWDVQKTVFCDGAFTHGKEKRVFKCWKKGGHGVVNFRKALAESCDVYYYQAGLEIGPDAIEEMARRFGMDALTRIDLPHEQKRPLPMAWKKTRPRSADRFWAGGETLNYAIGQGALQVTPIQMASVISVTASSGDIWQPYLVSESQRFGKFVEHLGGARLLGRVAISERSWTIVRNALEDVVKSGTGVASQIPGVRVSGKTGTAQASKGDDHAWFVAYAPSDQPQVACAVVVEHGGHGGSTAAPIAHDLLAMVLRSDEVGRGQKPEGVISD